MIDTIGLIVPINQKTYEILKNTTILTQRIDQQTGEIEFEYSNCSIHNSWNYRVLFRISDEKHVYDKQFKGVYLETGNYHIRFEFSAPKIVFGHNLLSISVEDMFDAIFHVKNAFETNFGVKLPIVSKWFLNRLDVCANFEMNSESEVKAYIQNLQRQNFPRRIRNNYEDTGIYFASRHNTLKLYAKGEEFKKHDLKRFVNEIEGKYHHNIAKKILRVEVELKTRLKYIVNKHITENIDKNEAWKIPLWSGYMTIYDTLEIINIKSELDRMIKNFLCGTETKVMKSLDVYKILKQNFSAMQARTFYAVYCMLVVQGIKETRKQFSKNMIYRTLKAFRASGISIITTDVKKLDIDTDFPSDFSLDISSDNKYYQMPYERMAA